MMHAVAVPPYGSVAPVPTPGLGVPTTGTCRQKISLPAGFTLQSNAIFLPNIGLEPRTTIETTIVSLGAYESYRIGA